MSRRVIKGDRGPRLPLFKDMDDAELRAAYPYYYRMACTSVELRYRYAGVYFRALELIEAIAKKRGIRVAVYDSENPDDHRRQAKPRRSRR